MKVLHIITDLNIGGAEIMLFRLLTNTSQQFQSEIISLTDIGPIGQKLKLKGINVHQLNMKANFISFFKCLLRLKKLKKKISPDIIQTWMYHADFVGSIIAVLFYKVPVIWGVHHTNIKHEGMKKLTYMVVKVCALLSKKIPKYIICCSKSTYTIHSVFGYPKEKMIIIPNGFDIELFRPYPGDKEKIREELDIPNKAFVIGLVGRFHPQKDHKNFYNAAKMFNKCNKDIYFVACGTNMNWDNINLVNLIDDNLKINCRLLDARDDMHRIYNAFDVITSSSAGEAFPLVIGEAMACGVPAVVTDVGDSSVIVGDTGVVVPPRDHEELYNGWKRIYNMDEVTRKKIGIAARCRILENFNICNIVKRYEDLYDCLV